MSSNNTSEPEKAPQASPAGPESESPDEQLPQDISGPNEPAQERGMRSSGSQVGPETIDLTDYSPNIQRAASAQHEKPSPAQIISKFSEFTEDVRIGYQWMRAHESQDPYQSRVFARLPTYQQVLSLIEPIVESLQQHGVVITTESFVSLLDEQYSAGPDSYADNPARWAIVNSFFATAMLNRSTTDFLKEVTPVARNYFKNAFSMLPELITQGRDVSACEALLSMAMFTQCTGDAHLTMQITAAATRLVQTLGLHRIRFYLSLDPIAAERHQRVFWVAYILDVDAMAKYDISPSLGDNRIPLTLQHDSSPRNPAEPCDFASPTLLRWRSELAVIQRRIQTQLNPGKAHRLTGDELLNDVRSMGEQLQEWESSLPEQVWAKEYPDDGLDLTISLALLHCAFLNSLTNVHMALVSLRAAERPGLDSSLNPPEGLLQAEIHKAWGACLGSARDMIEVAVNLPPQPFFQLWYDTWSLSPKVTPDDQLTRNCEKGNSVLPSISGPYSLVWNP